MTERVGLCAAAVAASITAASASRADAPPTQRDPKHRYQVRIPTGWSQQTVRHKSAQQELLAGWRGSPGEAMVVTRIDLRTPMLRRKKKAFFATLEAGLREGRAGYRLIRRRHHKLGRVRVYDLTFQHTSGTGREVVAMRFLFFGRYTLTLAVSIPADRWRKRRRMVRRQLRSFRPYYARK